MPEPSLKILVVEDDADTRELVADFFSRHGYVVTAVSRAEQALETLRSGSFDLVVSDNRLDDGPTGSWMLSKASSSGLLSDVGVVMYTAIVRSTCPSECASSRSRRRSASSNA